MATTKALELGQLGRRLTVDSAATAITFMESGVDSAAINSIIDSAVGPLIHNTFVYSADSGDTTFSGNDVNGSTLAYDVGNLLVQVNGVILVNGQDYTASNGSAIVLTEAADSGDDVTVNVFNTAATTFGEAVEQDYLYNATASQTIFTGADNNSNTLAVNAQGTIVSLNGLTLRPASDYTLTGSAVTLTAAADSGDEVLIRSFKTLAVADTVSATNGGTFTGNVAAKTIKATQPFHINGQTVTEDFTLATGNSAMAAGPVTINSGVTVALQSGTRWVVV